MMNVSLMTFHQQTFPCCLPNGVEVPPNSRFLGDRLEGHCLVLNLMAYQITGLTEAIIKWSGLMHAIGCGEVTLAFLLDVGAQNSNCHGLVIKARLQN